MDRLIAENGQDLYRIAWALTGDAAKAEELVGRTFRLARNELRPRQEWMGQNAWLLHLLLRRILPPFRGSFSRTGTTTPGALQTVIGGLPFALKEVVVLKELQSLSYQQIAVILNLSQEKVAEMLSQARRLMMKQTFGEPIGVMNVAC